MDCSICMPGDTDIILGDGSIVPIRNLVERFEHGDFNPHPPETFSFDGNTVSLRPIVAGQKLPYSYNLIEITTATGGRLRFTPDHKILVDDENGPAWREASKLRVGDMLYAPRKLGPKKSQPRYVIDLLPKEFIVVDDDINNRVRKELKKKFGSLTKAAVKLSLKRGHLDSRRGLSISELERVAEALGFSWENLKVRVKSITYQGAHGPVRLRKRRIDEDMAYLLGLLAADGSLSRKEIKFYNTNKSLIRIYVKIYRRLFPGKRCWINVQTGGGKRWKKRMAVRCKNRVLLSIAQKLDIRGGLKPLFPLDEKIVSSFLRGYFDGDGTVKITRWRGWSSFKITFNLGKDRYEHAKGLQLLLKRLGIISKLYTYEDRVLLDISEREDVARFSSIVRSNHPFKRRRLLEMNKASKLPKKMGGLFEQLPLECGLLIRFLMDRYRIPLKRLPLSRSNLLRVTRQECRITRVNLRRVINVLRSYVRPDDKDFIKLNQLCNSSFFLDQVKEVKVVPSKEDYVYDITVDGVHNFIPEGIFTVSNCIEAPKLSEVMQSRNIKVLTLSDVVEVSGGPGNFRVKVRQRPRYVTDECTRCGDCVPACPVILKNEFDVGMGARKAIYLPFDQAEPGAYVIDIENCLNKPPNYLPCNRCVEACGPKCIDFEMKEKTHELEVGAIIVAAGSDLFDASLIPEFSYGRHPDILTAMELERLLQSSGPSRGEVIKPSDHHHPEKVAFILCVGARDKRFYSFCSRVCCMYSIKEALQLVDHGIKNVTVFYMDIRAYGKGFDEMFERARNSGVRFVRSRPGRIIPNGHGIDVFYEDTTSGELRRETFDMVVLSTALTPSEELRKLADTLGIEVGEDGFIKSYEVDGDFVGTSREGIYVCGCASGPKDIPDSVTEAGAAAAKALTHLTAKSLEPEVYEETIDPSGMPRVGVFICHCGSNIAGVVDIKAAAEQARKLPYVAHVDDQKFSCSGAGTKYIENVIREKKLNRVVVAACSPKTHSPTFMRACARAGLNPYLFEMANIRNLNSWVHKNQPAEATEKAVDLIGMAVRKVALQTPLTKLKSNVVQKALVIGGGVAGMTAATVLANMGFETHLVEKERQLGGLLRYLKEIAPSGLDAQRFLRWKMMQLEKSGAKIHLGTEVTSVTGFVGNYHVTLSNGEELDVGAVIIATGGKPHEPSWPGTAANGMHVATLMNYELEGVPDNVRNIAFVGCVGSRNQNRGCSRYCCQTIIYHALKLRRAGKNVSVFVKDVRTYSRGAEELYRKACEEGVRFIRVGQEKPIEELVQIDDGGLTAYDIVSGETVSIPADYIVLATALDPPAEITAAQHLRVAKDSEGFFLELHPKLGPVESITGGVFLAGVAQGPKDVRESVSQGLAAAAKAAALLTSPQLEKEPFIPVINTQRCTKCMRCAEVCPYGAIKGERGKWIEVVPGLCEGCGACVAECNVEGAITMPGFTDEQIIAQIDAALAENPQDKVIVFACNWCSYAGADLAGILKIQYPASNRVIRTMCSARVSQKFILHAFEKGAGAVFVTGCWPQDCHYNYANLNTKKRYERWLRIIQARKIDPKRLQLHWISAAEAKRFAEKMNEAHQVVVSLKKEVRG
ncbi:MAG: hydrogenase iron-sulfur subunit [Candidatus Caldarchaeum sp.]